jgi:prolyl-tRNA synthetase
MDAIDSNELIMTTLQRKEIWEKTDRWSDKNVDIWFKTKLQDDTELVWRGVMKSRSSR